MPESTPCPDAARLQDLLAGFLSAREQEEVSRHVEECGPCQVVLEQLTASSWEGRAGDLRHGASVAPAVERIIAAAAGQPTAAEPNTAPKSPAAIGDFLRPSERAGSLGRLDHYEIEEVVGQGGFGVVFRAFDTKLHRIVAIKALSPELAASATARKRFIREAQAAAVIKNDHVIAIHGVYEENAPPFLVMEFVEGMSLQEKLDAGGALEVKEILRVAIQIAEGLAAAHKQGLVHRDIKPANILLENGVQRVKITDFGLARAVDDASLTQSGVIAGTPMYMAPEQAAGETVDHRADLFSLGSVIYTMCTGRPPFRASGTMAVLKRVIEDEARPVREVNPELPEWIEGIIAKLHAKRRENRFQSAKDLADLLAQHLAHVQQPGLTPIPAPTPKTGTSAEQSRESEVPSQEAQPRRRPSGARGRAATSVGFALLLAVVGFAQLDLMQWIEGQTAELFGTIAYLFAAAYLAWLGIWTVLARAVDGQRGWRLLATSRTNWLLAALFAAVTVLFTAWVRWPPDAFERLYQNFFIDGPLHVLLGLAGGVLCVITFLMVWLGHRQTPPGYPADASSARRPVWKRFAGTAVMVALALAFTEWRGVTNLRSFVLGRFDPVVAFQVDEPPVLVKIYETGDEDENAPKFSFKLRGGPLSDFGPAQTLTVDANFKTVRLPPGRYWVMASKDARMIHRKLIKVERGAETLVRISGAEKKPGDASDTARLQGKWFFDKAEKDGRSVGSTAAPPWIEFAGERFNVQTTGTAITEQEFAIDPTKEPKQIYFFGIGTNNLGIGIYKLDGDTLTLCVARPGQPRPTEFKTTPGSGQQLSVYKRGNPPDAADWVRLLDLDGWWSQEKGWNISRGMLHIPLGVKEACLQTARTDYENFHLRAEIEMSGGVAGIAFRFPGKLANRAWRSALVRNTDVRFRYPDKQPDGVYEAALCSGDRNPIKTGSLWHLGEAGAFLEDLTQPGVPFLYEIIAIGNEITLKVNGRTTTQWIDPTNRYTKGAIALRVYCPASVVHFRKIEVKELPASAARDNLLGVWDVIELWDNGVKGAKDEAPTHVVITAETLKMLKDGKETDRYLYEIEPGRNPKRIRLADVHEGGPWQGIYELQGDTLRICTNDKIGGKLPTAFESLPDSHNDVLFVLRRSAGGLTAPVTPTPP